MQPALVGLSSENEYEQQVRHLPVYMRPAITATPTHETQHGVWQRLERIQRNAVKLQQLAVQQRLADLHRPIRPTLAIQKIRAQSQRAKEPACKQPIRSSARVRGVAADGATSSSDAANTSHPDEASKSQDTSAICWPRTTCDYTACCNCCRDTYHNVNQCVDAAVL